MRSSTKCTTRFSAFILLAFFPNPSKSQNACDSSPCLNEAECMGMGPTEYFCFCPDGYEGTNCETMLNNPCDNRPCLNEAIECIPDSPNDFRCICNQGFMGNTCQINIDDCALEPCQNSGLCIDGINEFSCECRAGYEGVFCEEELDPCDSYPCLNGGVCTKYTGVLYMCTCHPDYEGQNCAVRKDSGQGSNLPATTTNSPSGGNGNDTPPSPVEDDDTSHEHPHPPDPNDTVIFGINITKLIENLQKKEFLLQPKVMASLAGIALILFLILKFVCCRGNDNPQATSTIAPTNFVDI